MIRTFVVILLLSIIANEAPAQLPPQPRPEGTWGTSLLQTRFTPVGLGHGPYSLFLLLRDPKVSDELQMSVQQVKDWEVLWDDMSKRRDAWNRKMQGPHTELIAKIRQSRNDDGLGSVAYNKIEGQLVNMEAQMKAQSKEMAESFDQSLTKVLDAKQLARLGEIRLQAEGIDAFKRREIQTALALTPGQNTAINQAAFQYTRQLRKVSMLPPGVKTPGAFITNNAEREANALAIAKVVAEMVKTRTEALRSVDAILTDVQREAYRKAIGPDFDFFENR